MMEQLESLVGSPVAVNELKHKPDRRRTLRASGSRRTAIVKLYESDRAPVVAARLAALAAGPPEPEVPRVLHLDPGRRMLVLSEVDGDPLRTSILGGDLPACARVGRALATWHRAWRNTHSRAFRPQTFEDEKRILLAQAADVPPAISAAVRAALPALERTWTCTTVIHRDLYEEQILLGDRVGLIDLDDAALGPPELDVGNLLAHIELLKLRSGRNFEPMVGALLGGYGQASLDQDLLGRCRKLSLLRLACIHERPELVERALSEGAPPARTSARSRDATGLAKRKLRIAFYSPRSSHLELTLAHGGDPIFLHDLFAALRARGHEIEVVSRLNIRDVWRGRVPARRLIREAIAIRMRMKRFSPDAWLVYDTSQTYPDVFGWWQRPSRYVLLAAHSWRSGRIPKHWRWILSFAHRRSLRRAHVVTVDRADRAERLRARGVDEGRLRVIPPSAKLIDAVPSQDESRLRLGLPRDAPIILCATRFTGPEERKQGKTEMILDLLSVLALLPDNVVLVLVGDGPGRSRIEGEVSRLQLGRRVRLVGAVENADVKWFFAACDLYAYPYPHDIPSVSVLEAQGCGRPVVTMRTGSGELTVDAGTSGLLADTLSEFRDHLAALTSDRARCAAMGRAARQFISDFHSTEVRARQIEELLSG
jgi:glycosyltransferase involved in cell wall biosynthesis/aminoglycoside phosphotransferase (APT) family kinase protein